MPFFLAGSPAQLLESLADLTSLPTPAVAPAPAVPDPADLGAFTGFVEAAPAAGLCSVPLILALAASAPDLPADLISSGFLGGTAFLAGEDIIKRMAAASDSALRLRSPRSAARTTSSASRTAEETAAASRSINCTFASSCAFFSALRALAAAASMAS